jgi:hypothetical protein
VNRLRLPLESSPRRQRLVGFPGGLFAGSFCTKAVLFSVLTVLFGRGAMDIGLAVSD